MAETYRMSMAETYLRRQREPARGGLVIAGGARHARRCSSMGFMSDSPRSSGCAERAIDVDGGAHRIELRAPGYETLTFSVMIEPNGLVRYRGDMQPIATKPAAVAAPPQPTAAAKSFYVIPNCYAGDKPPSGALPKGCDSRICKRVSNC